MLRPSIPRSPLRLWAIRLWMDLLLLLQHLHELLDLSRAGLCLLDRLDAEQDGVAVDAVERGEESLGAGVLVQCGLEIAGYRGGALAVVGRLPASVLPGLLHRREPGPLPPAPR